MLDKIFNDLNFHFSVEASIVLLILVFLEAVLSADNAIALAAIAQGLEDKKREDQALNIGLVFAYILRITLLLTATWVQKFWQFELLGAGYLLWLVFQHFNSQEDESNHHHGPRFNSLWQAIPVIALTDLAFSLDSVTTAIAVSQETWLVITGTTIGIFTLRFMAGLFIRWLDEYENLEDAGYITVAFVGLRLLLKVINDDLVPPQWLVVTVIGVILAWGFSKRTVVELVPEEREKTEVSK
ncbi:TerC family protein [Dolichospermum circinale]|uniref:TerC family protein n=1 Tax=Dolichospermum circinale TaxID=109265 RepID=UPI00047F491F|nr:TerC family protein [Dolichospermum circinale]MDB9484608.1 TerC family protein [Dolichospermum circinale CS-537/05]MDB9454283.1 TerC family protein [Dolichospermum circinale CS-541/06]MDB9464948.1 TerC family protein [Dolichospermum circinale CS-541/04]MDB9476876.1 TerC family protein [Dolichospermum circinale CS-537/11]MDB9479722.1 TerC family protein [Dolichospermum circinale CS-537/03]